EPATAQRAAGGREGRTLDRAHRRVPVAGVRRSCSRVGGRRVAAVSRGEAPVLGRSELRCNLGNAWRGAHLGFYRSRACGCRACGYHDPAVSKPSPGATSSSPRSDKGTHPPAANKDRGTKKRAPSPPAEPGLARIVAIANQKGGVGKSTTAVSLGAALAELGYRILVVDLDPQGNASTGMGIRHEARGVTVYDVVLSEAPVESAIVPTSVKYLDAVPSTIDLAGAEIELVSQFSREARLKKALAPVGEGRYDFIFLDCPPSL